MSKGYATCVDFSETLARFPHAQESGAALVKRYAELIRQTLDLITDFALSQTHYIAITGHQAHWRIVIEQGNKDPWRSALSRCVLWSSQERIR